jgi:hypothetical protein
MKNGLCFFTAAVVLTTGSALAQDLPEPPPSTPTARDVYIGCSLAIRNTEVANVRKDFAPPYSAIACGLVAFSALGYSRKIKPGNEWEYCMPENAAMAANPLNAMATEYVNLYEHYRFPDPDKQGLTMMLYMFKIGWPCAKSK